ncbi:hypothetical protein MCEREM21A_01734 [Sphingomonadaceae bacterium]|jgi:hypothetical protein
MCAAFTLAKGLKCEDRRMAIYPFASSLGQTPTGITRLDLDRNEKS